MKKLQRLTRAAPRAPLVDPGLQLTRERAPRMTPRGSSLPFEAVAAAARRTCAACEANPLEPHHPQRASPALALWIERTRRGVAGVPWSTCAAAAQATCAACPLERVRAICIACPLVDFLSMLTAHA